MSVESILIPKANVPKQYLDSLDGQIKHILQNKNLPSDVKFNLYSQVLAKWNDVQEDMKKPTKATFIHKEPKTYDLLESIPKSQQGKAKKLHHFIENLPNITIKPNGVVAIDGKEIRNSNIVEIVEDLVRNKKNARPPTGTKQLAKELKNSDVPIEYITNKQRLSWFQQQQYTENSPEIYHSPWKNY